MRKTVVVVKHSGLLGRLYCWSLQKEMALAWMELCDQFIPSFNDHIDEWNEEYTSLYGDDTSTIWKRMRYDRFISRKANGLWNSWIIGIEVYKFENGRHLWMKPRYTNKGLRFDLEYCGYRFLGCGNVILKCKDV